MLSGLQECVVFKMLRLKSWYHIITLACAPPLLEHWLGVPWRRQPKILPQLCTTTPCFFFMHACKWAINSTSVSKDSHQHLHKVNA